MTRLNKLKKIRIHQEGTHILLMLFFGILIVNGALFLLFDTKIPFYSVVTVSVVFFLLVLNFFRSPKRTYEGDVEKLVLAPADGKVVVIEEVDENDHFHDRRKMVSIFMSVFNVHANWFPVEGKVIRVEHENGRFRKAYLPKASTENERSLVVIKTPEGTEVLVRQIAGAVARRIVTYAHEGEDCLIDQHMGFIKFGSRVDVYLPLDTEVCVTLGEKTVGDETVIAKLK